MRRGLAMGGMLGAVAGLLALIGQPAARGDAYLCYKGLPIRAQFLPAFMSRPGTIVVDRFGSAALRDPHRLDIVSNDATYTVVAP